MKFSKLFHSKIRIFLLFSLTMVVSSIIIVITIYKGELSQAEKLFRQEALGDIRLVNSLLNQDDLNNLLLNKKNEIVVEKLEKILISKNSITSFYIRKLEKESFDNNKTKNLFFLSSKKIYQREGKLVEEHRFFMDAIKKSLETQEPQVTKVYTDIYGIWISAIMPVRSTDGDIRFFICLNKDASKLKKGEDYYSIAITVLSIVFLFVTLYFITSIRMYESNKYLNQRIKESNEALEEQLQYVMETEKMAALGNLVAGVAHEINTPLGVSITSVSYLESIINKYREKLEQGTMTKTDLFEMMDKIGESTKIIIKNLNNAANLIQSFKRIAVDQSSNSIINFNLKDLIESIILSLKHEYKTLQVEIKIEVPRDLSLHTDPGALVQIVTNFIINGIKHGKVEDKDLVITLKAEEKENSVLLSYEDNGRGIENKHLPHIFEPFYTTSKNKGGSGLGLNIVYNLVTQTLKGTIHVESVVDEYTKFIIEFPREIALEKVFIKDLDK